MSSQDPGLITLVHVSGEEATNFLQGQLTADVAKQASNTWQYAGHCDAKGKLWAVMRVVKIDDAYYLLIPSSCAEASLTQLKKFSVFSRVTFTDLSGTLFTGFEPNHSLPLFTVQLDGSQQAQPTDIHLGLGDACLHISNEKPDNNSEAWLRYELNHGVPYLAEATIGEYVPQMLGLDRLGGVNFKKGCYIGQETVARMHYLGQNKRLPRLLRGEANDIPAAGTVLEQKMGDNWRRAGAVINAVRYDSDQVEVLAVLPANIEDDVTIRIKGDEQSNFTLRPKFDNQEISNE